MREKNLHFGIYAFFLIITVLGAGCAGQPLKGVSDTGQKIYLNSPDISQSTSYQTFSAGQKSEVDKLFYLAGRVKESGQLQFMNNGTWYSSKDAYDACMFVIKKHYTKGTDARAFIRDHVWRSNSSGSPNLVRFPDGPVHIGYYLLLNELELLEATVLK